MQAFELDVLLAPGVMIFFTTLLISFWVTRFPVFSIIAAFGKSGFFLVYFGGLFDGTYTFLDDWNYLAGGASLLAHDVLLTNLMDNWEYVLMIGGGDHFVYYLYNAYAIRIFEEGYYAPVALNILLTVLIAWFGARLSAREFGFVGVWEKVFFVFLLFHPDIFIWSNIMNGKDILVLLLHVSLLFSASLFFRGQYRQGIALVIPVFLLLFFLRFYVPVLFICAFVSSLVLMRRYRGGWRLFVVGVCLVVLAFGWIGMEGFQYYALKIVQGKFVNPLYGFVRFALTPIPFHTDSAYSFLNIPALIHWIFIPFTIWGVVLMLRQKTPYARFFLLYVIMFFGLYAVYGVLQGPRHRVQLDFAWAVLQFIGIKMFFRRMFTLRKLSWQKPYPESRL